MPRVCIDRPNRSKPRKYTEKDAGRIVCRVVSEGGDRKKLQEEIQQCLELCDNERVRAGIIEILDKAKALSIAVTTVLAILAGVTLVTIVLSRIPLIRALLSPIARQLEAQKSALEQGLTIESTAQRILDDLL